MTLVQASIADSGNAVILIADRLLTTTLSSDLPSYELEAGSPKLIFRNHTGIGFAGSSIHADACISSLNEKNDFNEIVNTISGYISSARNTRIEKDIKRLTGVTSEQFFTNKELPIPSEVRDNIYYLIKKFRINCQSIIAGIDEEGDVIEATNFNAFPIGSGAPFSKVYFDQLGYTPEMSANEAILFAFEAKKWAQAHTGVGERADILVFRKESEEIKVQEIYDNSELMNNMRDVYTAEIKNREDVRKTLLKNMFDMEGE
jgi:hypothetical protein